MAPAAIAALVSHERLVVDTDRQTTQYRLVEFNLSDFVRLDAAALRALNLTPSPGDGAGAGPRRSPSSPHLLQ